jgi:large subunit ribosomal protein L3
MGAVNCTVQNLSVVMVDGERGILVIRGAIPGPKGGIVTVKNTVKAAE